jgi:hypothetical protein
MMRFELDEDKSQANKKEHGVDFKQPKQYGMILYAAAVKDVLLWACHRASAGFCIRTVLEQYVAG